MEATVCPLCAADEAEPLFVGRDVLFDFPGEFPVMRCRRCGLTYNNPRVPPDEIHRFYGADYHAHDAMSPTSRRCGTAETAVPQVDRRRRGGLAAWDRVERFGGARLLDVGCGGGSYLARMQGRGWDVLGVDPMPRAVESCRASGVPAMLGTVPGVDLGGRRFELFTLRASLANLPAPRATLAALREYAAPGAVLIASAFNSDGWLARRCGPLWPGWDLPRQYCHYAPHTMRRLLETTGWRVERLEFRRRPNLARRAARLMAEATGRRMWRLAASRRWLTSLMSTCCAGMQRADEICAVARAAAERAPVRTANV